jgi:deazaflavin-dependent oxidoreductase (nitroreductase family)
VLITLTITGRHSGQAREVRLYAFADGDEDLVITGSWAGRPNDPGWVLDLRAEPRASVRRGRTETPVRAREAQGPERERLWQLVCAGFPLYESYQRRTSRAFPIFVLEPDRGVDVG